MALSPSQLRARRAWASTRARILLGDRVELDRILSRVAAVGVRAAAGELGISRQSVYSLAAECPELAEGLAALGTPAEKTVRFREGKGGWKKRPGA